MPHDVIMPALGMTQDTGLLIAWSKRPGDKVRASDVLFEVETDKSTMEVEAGQDGYLAELRAEAGESVPVGEVIAVITGDRPDVPVQRSWNAAATQDSGAKKLPEEPTKVPKAEPQPRPAPRSTAETMLAATGDRILASPKVKRLAAEQGLDLSHLAKAGHPQPFHVADLETLRNLSAAVPAATPMRLSASVPSDGFDTFREWLAAEANEPVPTAAILAAFLAGALRAGRREPAGPLAIAVETPAAGRTLYKDADIPGISNVKPSQEYGEPAILLRDLMETRLDGAHLGSTAIPVLTVTRRGEDIAIGLEADQHMPTSDLAIGLVSEFVARLETPLRQLL